LSLGWPVTARPEFAHEDFRDRGLGLYRLRCHRGAARRRPLIGDIRDPQAWIRQLAAIDGVVHLAATFDGDMAKVERTLLDGLLDAAALPPAVPKRRFIYQVMDSPLIRVGCGSPL
jgi:nucleoside-diphosphate-sugar epimerase